MDHHDHQGNHDFTPNNHESKLPLSHEHHGPEEHAAVLVSASTSTASLSDHQHYTPSTDAPKETVHAHDNQDHAAGDAKSLTAAHDHSHHATSATSPKSGGNTSEVSSASSYTFIPKIYSLL